MPRKNSAPPPAAPPRRILVLGSSGHAPSVQSHSWSYIPSALNVADYDTVILDFVPLQIDAIAKAINIDTVPSFRQFSRLLFSEESEIVVVGKVGYSLGANPHLPSTWFLPLEPVFFDERGETIELIDLEFEFYFQHVLAWTQCLSSWGQTAARTDYLLAANIPPRANIAPRLRPIAENRYHRAVAWEVTFEVETEHGEEIGRSGTVLFLPPPTEISDRDAVALLLRERYHVLQDTEPPPWTSEHRLPLEIPIVDEINRLQGEIEQSSRLLDGARERLAAVTRFKKLLYESGEDVLEPVVRAALRELGASVIDPLVRGRDDGRLTDPAGREATLEIKGRAGQLRVDDIRQLHQWVSDSLAHESRASKGLLVANLKKEDPPASRADLFPSNCIELAKTWRIAVLTTSQLFRALQDQQQGGFDSASFWETIRTSDGPCDLPGPA